MNETFRTLLKLIWENESAARQAQREKLLYQEDDPMQADLERLFEDHMANARGLRARLKHERELEERRPPR